MFQYFVVSQDIFTMASFYYNYQNPSGFCVFMLIRAIVLCRPLGLQNLNLKRKTKWILVVVVKWRHHENGLLRASISYPESSGSVASGWSPWETPWNLGNSLLTNRLPKSLRTLVRDRLPATDREMSPRSHQKSLIFSGKKTGPEWAAEIESIEDRALIGRLMAELTLLWTLIRCYTAF